MCLYDFFLKCFKFELIGLHKSNHVGKKTIFDKIKPSISNLNHIVPSIGLHFEVISEVAHTHTPRPPPHYLTKF